MTATLSEEVMATRWQRFFNYLIDSIVQYSLVILIATSIALKNELLGSDLYSNDFEYTTELQEYLYEILLMLGYYFFMEAYIKGRTVGKFITGTIVVDENGDVPTAVAILKRTFSRLIPFDALSYFGRRGWHDSISATYVVNKQAWETSRELQLSFNEIGTRTEEL